MYTSSFTVGPSQDYDSLSQAQADLRGVIQEGDSILLTLVPSSLDYDGRLNWTDLRNWTTSSFEFTVSGDTSGIDWFNYCVEPNTNHRFANNTNGDKTFNFIGISFVASGPSLNRTLCRIDNPTQEGNITFNFIRCKMDFSESTAGRINTFEDRRTSDSSSTYSFNASSCVIRSDDRSFLRVVGTPASGHTSYNFEGCTLHTTGSKFLNPWNTSTHSHTVNMSGCLALGGDFVDTGGAATNFSGYVEDCIFSEASTNTQVWAPNSRVNVTNSTTFDFAPTSITDGVVYFSGTDTTFTDYRLVDDDSNLAKGYVTGTTPPSPDLLGNDRGTPFDAGGIAITLDSGGVNVTAAFGNVYVRLY